MKAASIIAFTDFPTTEFNFDTTFHLHTAQAGRPRRTVILSIQAARGIGFARHRNAS